MADFMGYFQTNMAREVGRLRGWRDKVWSRRYEAVVISDEPAAQVDSKKSPAPRFHAATKAAREALRIAYGLFLAAFREAAERLKGGDRSARFPNGCFTPGLPFVRA